MNDELKNINDVKKTRNISNMYEDWFLDYASYVILERAIPKIDDGLKPVQRRILHSMKEMDDSRYNKVANIIGHTMQYHPHGDKAIGDALVTLGQKDLLIDMQGNWGDPRTGDRAAAPRYIEARLSEFALEVLFNKNITKFTNSYDGRKKEPISLPTKFPLILYQGVEGIAVGLSTRILPHNFVEIIKSSIAFLNDKSFKLFPDFDSGGQIDVKNYNNGLKGGKIRLRSTIEIADKETLKISSLPYGITTSSLIDSIVKANNNSKIKIKNIEDNTAQNVEIIVKLIKGVSPNITIDALYAFTYCEISVSTNCCIIVDNKPQFISISDLLKFSTQNTVAILKEELEYKLNSLNEKWHISNLEKIFIENKIYRKIEECTTWDSIISIISKEINFFSNLLKKKISQEDIVKLTDLKIKRISKYDTSRQSEYIRKIESEINEVLKNINDITDYSIKFYKHLLIKYGENKKRKTSIVEFDSISARRVVVANQKLFINRKEGFVGTALKKDEFVCKCSDLDNLIVFLEDGTYLITSVDRKKYVGKNIIHVAVWKKNQKHRIYNVVYKDGLSKTSYVKRFSVTSLIKDRSYNLTQGNNDSKILYFTSNPNSESETININLHSKSKAKNKLIEYDFGTLLIKGKKSKGNILTKDPIRKIIQKEIGESTLGGRDIWIDENIGRLNADERGLYLGKFNSDDKIIIFYFDGTYEMQTFDFSNRFKMKDIVYINKFNRNTIYTLLHKDGKSKNIYIKRFKIETQSLTKKFLIISENRGSKFIILSTFNSLFINYNYFIKNGDKKNKEVFVDDFVSLKGWKALGNKLDDKKRMSSFNFVENEKENSDINNELTLF